MTVLRQEQIEMMDEMIREERVSGRQAAALLQVTEGALRYRRKRLASGARDRRAEQATAVAGMEAAVTTVLEALAPTAPEGRPICGRLVFEALVRDHGYTGSYPALIRYLRRARGRSPVRAVRRVELPPGMQAQHDWLEERVALAGSPVRVFGLLGTLAHSRGSALWLGLRMTQVAWQAGHAALFQSYGGVPRVVRIDNLKTAVAAGAGPSAVFTPAFQAFATSCGFTIDPCRVRTPQDKGKVERRVRVIHTALAPLFRQSWTDLSPVAGGRHGPAGRAGGAAPLPRDGHDHRGRAPRRAGRAVAAAGRWGAVRPDRRAARASRCPRVVRRAAVLRPVCLGGARRRGARDRAPCRGPSRRRGGGPASAPHRAAAPTASSRDPTDDGASPTADVPGPAASPLRGPVDGARVAPAPTRARARLQSRRADHGWRVASSRTYAALTLTGSLERDGASSR